MSGNSMHAAFWTPYDNENSLPISWQPVPIHVLPAASDYVREFSIVEYTVSVIFRQINNKNLFYRVFTKQNTNAPSTIKC